MLNENHDELNWRSRLGEVKSLPDQLLPDKNAAWEKLHGRLQSNPRRIKPLWYWAAACLLVSLTIPYLTINKKQQAWVKNKPAKTVSKQTTSIEPVVKGNEVRNVIIVTAVNKEVKKPASISNNKKDFEREIQKRQPIPAAGFNEPIITAQQQKTTLPQRANELSAVPVVTAGARLKVVHINELDRALIETTAMPVLTTATAPKKLKVVHINELGTPVIIPYNLVHADDYGQVQIRLINQETYNNSKIPSTNSSFNIFKTRNAPSN